MNLLNALITRIKAEQQEIADSMMAGNCVNFESYQRLVGQGQPTGIAVNIQNSAGQFLAGAQQYTMFDAVHIIKSTTVRLERCWVNFDGFDQWVMGRFVGPIGVNHHLNIGSALTDE